MRDTKDEDLLPGRYVQRSSAFGFGAKNAIAQGTSPYTAYFMNVMSRRSPSGLPIESTFSFTDKLQFIGEAIKHETGKPFVVRRFSTMIEIGHDRTVVALEKEFIEATDPRAIVSMIIERERPRFHRHITPEEYRYVQECCGRLSVSETAFRIGLAIPTIKKIFAASYPS